MTHGKAKPYVKYKGGYTMQSDTMMLYKLIILFCRNISIQCRHFGTLFHILEQMNYHTSVTFRRKSKSHIDDGESKNTPALYSVLS